MPLGRDLQDNPLDQELQVAEEDEGGRGRGPAMVLLNQVVALELPDLVCVFLHFLERVAGGRQGCMYHNACGDTTFQGQVQQKGEQEVSQMPSGGWLLGTGEDRKSQGF